MPDVLVLAFFWLARLDGLGRIAALENLHPCFFISADDEASFLVKAQSLAIELTNILRLALKVGIVAVEPVHTPMRLEVGLLQDAPDAGATEGLQPMLRECCDQVVQTPPGGGTMIRGRLPRADWRVGPARRSGGSADSERRKLGAWNGRAQVIPNGRVPQEQG